MDYSEYYKYICCATAALTVLIIGWLEPVPLQDPNAKGLNYMYVALIVLVVTCLVQAFL